MKTGTSRHAWETWRAIRYQEEFCLKLHFTSIIEIDLEEDSEVGLEPSGEPFVKRRK